MTCKCNPDTWANETPPPVCSVYTAGIDGYCEECWHDKACHTAWSATWEEEIRKDERAKVLAEIKRKLGL